MNAFRTPGGGVLQLVAGNFLRSRTYDEARRLERESETDRDRGELPSRATVPFLRYLDEWVERYRGQGRRGFRESTREESSAPTLAATSPGA